MPLVLADESFMIRLADVEKQIGELKVRDAATALAVAKLCDGVVVGSRIVQEIEESTEQNVIANVSKLARELRQAVDQA